jgi:hypothetical protein
MNTEVNNTTLLYNYPDTTLYLNQYKNTFPKDGFIKIPYLSPKGVIEPNLVYKTKKYKTSYLYIVKKKYNFDIKKEYDAECIIEHVSVNDENKKVFLCFPLIRMIHNAERNQIDQLITQSERNSDFVELESSLHLNLNDLIIRIDDPHDVIMNREENLFIFKNPIYVSTNFDTLRKQDTSERLFQYNPNHTKIIKAEQIKKEGFENMISSFYPSFLKSKPSTIMEGYTQNDSYIQTRDLEQYMNDNFKELSVVATNRVEQMKNILVLLIVVGSCSMVVPFIYKFLIVDIVSNYIVDISKQSGSVISLSVTLFLFIIAMGLHILLAKNIKLEDQIIGFWILIACGICFFTILISRMINPKKYSLLTGDGVSTSYTNINFEILSGPLIRMMKEPGKFLFFFIGIICYYLLVGLLIGLLAKGGQKELLLPVFTVYIVPFLILIGVRFSILTPIFSKREESSTSSTE